MDVNCLTQILVNSRLLRNQQEILNFESTISSILNMEDLNHIQNLCMGFDDETEHDEVMFGLIHAIESYDKIFDSEQLLKKLSESLTYMLPHAKEWAKILHIRILNHEPSCKLYAKVILESDDKIKTIVLQLVTEIKEEDPEKFENSVYKFISYVSR